MLINLLAYSTDHQLPTRLNSLTLDGKEISTQLVSTIDEFHAIIRQQHFAAVLFDVADVVTPIDQLISELTEEQPGIRVLILPPDNNEKVLRFSEAVNFRLLSKPLTDEELVIALEDLIITPDQPEDELPVSVERETLEEPQAEEDHEPSLIEIIDTAMNELVEADEPQLVLDSANEEEPELLAILETSRAEAVIAPRELVDTVPPEISALRVSYSCVLVPRHPRQYLARDLADRAASILPLLHLSRGWQVTGISVRPQYLQWVISLPAEICPVEAIEEIRQRTSAHFYNQFPELAAGGQSRDFWAPGYLMMSGSQPLSPAIIREFIQRVHTRRQRGD